MLKSGGTKIDDENGAMKRGDARNAQGLLGCDQADGNTELGGVDDKGDTAGSRPKSLRTPKAGRRKATTKTG
jgi:hypothetical protein